MTEERMILREGQDPPLQGGGYDRPKPSPGERVAERKRGRVWGVIVPHLRQKSEIFDSSSQEEPLREGQDPPLRGWTRAVGYLVGIATAVCALPRNDVGGTRTV